MEKVDEGLKLNGEGLTEGDGQKEPDENAH